MLDMKQAVDRHLYGFPKSFAGVSYPVPSEGTRSIFCVTAETNIPQVILYEELSALGCLSSYAQWGKLGLIHPRIYVQLVTCFDAPLSLCHVNKIITLLSVLLVAHIQSYFVMAFFSTGNYLFWPFFLLLTLTVPYCQQLSNRKGKRKMLLA